MRKVILSMMVSLDGFIEGSKKELDWHVWDKEMDKYMINFFDTIDTLLFGRVTYQLMESYWPTASAPNDDPIITGKMNNLPKIVFSKTLDKAGWQNTTLLKEVNADEIAKMKQSRQGGSKNMVIFGGANLASAFLHMNLIDEYQIIVNPVILGKGEPLFRDSGDKLTLELLRTKIFSSGNVLLYYQPAKNKAS